MPGDVPLYITDGPVPRDYVVPNSGELLPLQVEGTIDGTSAASSFYAVLQVLDPNGRSMGKYISSAIAAGASADVTWFPRVAQALAATPSSGGLSVLYDSGFLGSAQLNIDTGNNGVAQTSTHLLIFIQAATTASVGEVMLGMRFNTDTGSNYNNHTFQIFQSTTSVGGSQGDSRMAVTILPGTTDAGSFGVGFVFIPFYTGPTDKIVLAFSANPIHTQSRLADGQWVSGSSAINRVQIQDYANGGNLTANSRMIVYGI